MLRLKQEMMTHHHPLELSHQALKSLKIDHGDDHDHGMDQGGAQGEETKGETPQVERDDDGEPIQPQRQVSHPRVH